MSTSIFPSLPGLAWDVKRTAQWNTNIVQSASGREVRVAQQSAPLYLYEISYEVLRYYSTFAEYPILMAFYNNRSGMLDTFLYDDPNDNHVATQAIGTGNGSNTAFQLIRAFGGSGSPKWIDIILAPHTVSAVYINGTQKTVNTDYTVSNWGSNTPGVITFTTPPSAGQTITADFTWYWPCRFLSDTLEINNIYNGFFSVDSVKFTTVF